MPRPRRPPSRELAAPQRLRALERLRLQFGGAARDRKLALLRGLERARLATPAQVLRLHELLCFWRAYPDDARVRSRVERMLRAFGRRTDLRRHARRLRDSGVAGTEIRFRFFAPMALWLARRWPGRLRVDWPQFDASALEPWLPLLALPAETPALDEYDLSPRGWIHRMSPLADADFLVRGLARLPMSDAAREILYDQLDPPLRLAAAPGTPSRTHAHVAPRRVGYVRALARGRPDPGEIARLRPRWERSVGRAEGERLIDLARAAMVTRSRDLDAFSHGDPRDVRLVGFEDGVEFACIGMRPERRLLLESVYGFLTLRNGVPVGYVLTASLFGSAEIAYNVFETFRGAEASFLYARVLAMTRALFGADVYMVPPYQLGEGNQEALESGAWWFYQKFGFRPRDRAARALLRSELRRIERDPEHRSSLATLRRLARSPVFLHLGAPRADVMGRLPLPRVGLAVMRSLRRFGSDRERAAQQTLRVAERRLGTRASSWAVEERGALERWAPLLAILPDLERWSTSERRALVEVVRAKGGRRESEYVRRFDAHPRLRSAVIALTAARRGRARRGA